MSRATATDNAVDLLRDLAKLLEEGARGSSGIGVEDCRAAANALWDWLRTRCRWCGAKITADRASAYCSEVCCMEDLGEEPFEENQ